MHSHADSEVLFCHTRSPKNKHQYDICIRSGLVASQSGLLNKRKAPMQTSIHRDSKPRQLHCGPSRSGCQSSVRVVQSAPRHNSPRNTTATAAE